MMAGWQSRPTILLSKYKADFLVVGLASPPYLKASSRLGLLTQQQKIKNPVFILSRVYWLLGRAELPFCRQKNYFLF
jgi:hypothetical protein